MIKSRLLLLTGIAYSATLGQNISPSQKSSGHVLYHFVRSSAYLASKADALESAERNDHGIRHAFAFTVGLTDSDALLVLNLAKSLDTQFAALDQQAAAIIQKAHGAVPAGGVVPPPPESLTQLQKQKASLISSLDSVFSAKLNLHSQAAIKQFTRSSHSDQTFSSEPNSKEKPSQ